MEPILTKSQTCKLFNCTKDQLNDQYKANAASFEKLYQKSLSSGKKVNGYTSEQLYDTMILYRKLAEI